MGDLSSQLYPNGFPMAVGVYIWDGLLWTKWTGAVSISGSVTSSGVIVDGVDALIKATVRDYSTSNPLAVALTDTTGNVIATLPISIASPLGQQLAAASIPVVLTAAQIATLTPFSSVTIGAGTAVIGNVKDAGYQNATWAVHHIPAANTQATITQASAGGGIKNVCLGFTVTLASSSTTAPAAIQLTANLIDGSSGGGTYLWRTVISLPAVAGAIASFNIQQAHGFEGSAATAMTIEFSAAGGANTIESVSMYGTTRL